MLEGVSATHRLSCVPTRRRSSQRRENQRNPREGEGGEEETKPSSVRAAARLPPPFQPLVRSPARVCRDFRRSDGGAGSSIHPQRGIGRASAAYGRSASPQTDRLSFVPGSYITDVAICQNAVAACLPLTAEIHHVFLSLPLSLSRPPFFFPQSRSSL